MHKLNLDQSQTTASTQSMEPQVATSEMTTAQPVISPVDEPVRPSNNDSSTMKSSSKLVIFFSVIAILAGVATGYGGYRLQAKSKPGSLIGGKQLERVAEGTVKAGDVFGVKDEKTFKDSAEGYLAAGGIDGEGSHQLVRAGGVSQTVYLTSSVTDLDKFVGMEVKIWGETFKGQKAGWLMDVGRVEVINPSAQPPQED